jgi:malate synthase
MTQRVQVGGLSVAAELHRFVNEEALPGSGIDPDAFWSGADAIIHDLAPRHRELLARREELQAQLDDYYRANPGVPADPAAYEAWLREIGYLVDEPGDFTIST